MAEYIVQKPIDLTKLTAKARTHVEQLTDFDITPKYDGCCAVPAFDCRGFFAGAFSATGEYAPSMERIGKWIEKNWAHPPLRDIALVGEAWIPGAEFPVINGTFRRQSVQPELRFVPFDAVRWQAGQDFPLLGDERPYIERLHELDRGYDTEYVIPLVHHTGSLQDADKLAKVWKAQGGFDGAIARNPYCAYEVGRCKHEVVKVKPVLSLDLRCVGTAVEPGEKTKRPVLTVEVEHNGVRTWVGSGVPHDLGELDVFAAIVEIECMGVTPDGKLREPRFKGIRYDKVEAD